MEKDAPYENIRIGEHTILTKAIWDSLTEIATFLIERGIGLNERHTIWKETPLMIAAEKGNLEITKLLLQHKDKIDLHAKDKDGKTALDWAKGKPEIETLIREAMK